MRHALWILLWAASACGEPAGPSPREVTTRAIAISGAVRLRGPWWSESRYICSTATCPEGCDIPRAAESLRLGPGGEMADAFVTVSRGVDIQEGSPPPKPVVIHHYQCEMTPRVLGVLPRQVVEFHNADGVMHDAHSQSQMTPGMGRGQSSNTSYSEFFTKAESAIRVVCDVHPWERAWIHVSDHPYFAVTGADGRYEIRNLPPGDYELRAWHERFKDKPLEGRIKVEAGRTATLDFTFEAPKK